MARNFVGSVTRHNERAGVTLRARVTNPDDTISMYQDFKCTVRATGLSDEQSVITDLNTITNRLLNNGVTGITENLTALMPTHGDHETNVTYDILNTGSIPITDYFNSDGIIIQRPSYGEDAVIGSMIIRVTKNAATASRTITVSIDPYTATEVVSSVTSRLTWDVIKGNNLSEANDGMNNVFTNLNLISTLPDNLTSNVIHINWTITDSLSNLINSGDPRIDTTTGILTRPKYSEVYEVKNNNTMYANYINTSKAKIEKLNPVDNNPQECTYMKMSGVILKASFSVPDTNGGTIEKEVVFNLKTMSKPLTNDEVGQLILKNIDNFHIWDSKTNMSYTTFDKDNPVSNTIYYDTTSPFVNASVLRLFSVQEVKDMLINSGFLNEIGLGINLRWTVMKPDTINNDNPVSWENGQYTYSQNGFQTPIDSTNEIINMRLDKQPTGGVSITKLYLCVIITASGYAEASSSVRAFYGFDLQDDTYVDPNANPTNPVTP